MSDTAADPEKYIKLFEAILLKPHPGANHSKLWYAWHYLQVYCHWGLQMPHTSAVLALQLRTKEPGSFGFFASAVEAYGSVHAACDMFLASVFPGIVDLGTDLRKFAEDATGRDGLFSAAIDLIDGEGGVAAALELLADLQATATANEEKAKVIAINLGGFQSKLITAHGQLKTVDAQVEADDKTSQAAIDRLMSEDPDPVKKKASLAGIKKFIKESEEKYKHYVTVAATTPTYGWVVIPFPPIPIGLFAAVIVAGIYGDAARKELILLRQYQEDLAKMEVELATALTAHGVQEAAHNQLTGATTHTKTAIDYTTDVQNAWKGIASDIGTIQTTVKQMTRLQGNEVVLSAKRVMEVYAKKAAEAWGRILPPLNDLTDKPYITVKSGTDTFATLVTELGGGS